MLEFSTLRVNELYRSIQGESTWAGEPCTFVRLTGCGLRCVWCDTAYAFTEGEEVSLADVIARVRALGCRTVELTGGEPLEQEGTFELMMQLCDDGFRVLVETGGHVDISRVDPRVHRIVDLKCPGSGMMKKNRDANIELLTDRDEVKFVIADRDDYEWAREMTRRHGLSERCRAVLFAPVHDSCDPTELASWILADGVPARLQLQLHKILWPAAARGV